MSTQSLSMNVRRSALREFAQRHAGLLLFVLVYALTWPFMLADVLGTRGVLPGRLPIGLQLVQAFMPSLAALLVAGLAGGRPAIGRLLRRLIQWRAGLRWYGVALAGYALLCLVAVLAHNALGLGPVLPLLVPEAAQSGPVGLVLTIALLIVVGVLTNGEELAWRGVALPWLQARYSALAASLIIGVGWALFHLPLFWVVGSSQADMPLAAVLLNSLGLSVLFTWLFNNTRGSVLLVTLFHAGINTWTRILPIDHASHALTWTLAGVTCLAALLVVVLSGPKHLAHGVDRVQDPDAAPEP